MLKHATETSGLMDFASRLNHKTTFRKLESVFVIGYKRGQKTYLLGTLVELDQSTTRPSENRTRTRRRTCPSFILSNTSDYPGREPGPRCQKPATNRLICHPPRNRRIQVSFPEIDHIARHTAVHRNLYHLLNKLFMSCADASHLTGNGFVTIT